jgi:hypothetical protein
MELAGTHCLNTHPLNEQTNYYVYDAIYPDGFADKEEFAEHVRQKYLIWQAQYLE